MDITTKESIASQIDGIEYPCHISKEIKLAARDANIVIIYGMSDDLAELAGAVDDEMYTFKLQFDRDGLIPNRDDIDSDDDLRDYFRRTDGRLADVQIVWESEFTEEERALGYTSWICRATIPHATFDIMEDGEKFCRGIVISLDDI